MDSPIIMRQTPIGQPGQRAGLMQHQSTSGAVFVLFAGRSYFERYNFRVNFVSLWIVLMSDEVQFPLSYELNTRVWLAELSLRYGYRVTLANVPDEELQRLNDFRFDVIWLMGVWQTGSYSRELALQDEELLRYLGKVLPDWTEADIGSSPYSVSAYRVSEDLGGDAGLVLFRDKLHRRSMRLILDFVPNHTAVECTWVRTNPEYYICIPAEVLPHMDAGSYFTTPDSLNLACGYLQYAPVWKDTLQLNYARTDVQKIMIDELRRVARRCDGVRCDTAIAILKDTFNRTWGELAGIMEDEFWNKAIEEVKQENQDFFFIAEVYGEMEWHLQCLGFDFTYDKVLYDRLVGRDFPAIKDHLRADWDFTRKLVRFTENHDWPRATEVFGLNNKASSLMAFLAPGLRLVHQGQLEGRTKQLSVYLLRQPAEEEDREIAAFYERLFALIHSPAISRGDFNLLEIAGDAVIGFERTCGVQNRFICVVNLTERDSETPFATDAFASVQDYREVHLLSTERHRSPQFDLWRGGITVRLRAHEGLVFCFP
jgi:glycosidase